MSLKAKGALLLVLYPVFVWSVAEDVSTFLLCGLLPSVALFPISILLAKRIRKGEVKNTPSNSSFVLAQANGWHDLNQDEIAPIVDWHYRLITQFSDLAVARVLNFLESQHIQSDHTQTRIYLAHIEAYFILETLEMKRKVLPERLLAIFRNQYVNRFEVTFSDSNPRVIYDHLEKQKMSYPEKFKLYPGFVWNLIWEAEKGEEQFLEISNVVNTAMVSYFAVLNTQYIQIKAAS